ncbi:MAG TPA: class I SAM-dependent methyltransferase [Candidatus Limnocylindria bacterium]|nr:class I SAM-dependent methyltransferase [Candidatus Limnocylindria bacterium]
MTSRRPRGGPPRETSWERVASWYDGWVGERGSAYHRQLAIPALLELLDPQPGERVLDVGGGQGVLAPYLVEAGAGVTVVDASAQLIAAAKRRHGRLREARFVVGDARRLPSLTALEPASFDAATFLLSIQDMDPLDDVIRGVSWALKDRSRIVMVMTHPAFRQARHSGWGYDEARKLTYRRIDGYLSELAVPMKSLGGGPPTRSFHRPIGTYVNALAEAGFCTDAMLELPDLPPDRRPGRRPTGDERANAEIPIFLALRAVRG